MKLTEVCGNNDAVVGNRFVRQEVLEVGVRGRFVTLQKAVSVKCNDWSGASVEESR